MLWWNGAPLPIPSAPLAYTYRDIEGTNSGQTLGGSYSKKVIAQKEDVSARWEGLSAKEAAALAQVKKSVYGNLTFYSPQAGKFVTRFMYTEDLSEEIESASLSSGTLNADLSASLRFKQR